MLNPKFTKIVKGFLMCLFKTLSKVVCSCYTPAAATFLTCNANRHGKVSVEIAMFECLIDDVTLHFALGTVLMKVECFKQAMQIVRHTWVPLQL